MKWFKPGCQGCHSADCDGGQGHSPSRVPGFCLGKTRQVKQRTPIRWWILYANVDTLQTLSEDLLKEGRKKEMRVLVSMWISLFVTSNK